MDKEEQESQSKIVAELEEMKNKRGELKELANTNWYRWLLKYWGYYVFAVTISMIIGAVISHYTPPLISPIEPARIDEIAKIMLAPSITIMGISIAFLPVVSFFFMNDLKDEKEKSGKLWKEREAKLKENKELATEENLIILNNYCAFEYATWINMISGVMKYVRTFLFISLFSLIFLLDLFVFLPSRYFILIDIWLLTSVLGGVIPILIMTFHKPALRFRDYIIIDRIETRLEAEW